MKSKRILERKQVFTIVLTLGLMSSTSFLYLIQIEYQQKRSNVKVMTWNIHKGINIDGEFNLERIIKTIKENQPDIVGLQELDEEIAKKIADKLDMDYFFGADLDDDEGNAILSKYTIKEAEKIYLSPDDERSLVKAKILVKSEKWNIFITHLSLRSRENNLKQVEDILTKVLKKYSENVLLLGDFNFGPNSEQYQKIINHNNPKLIDTYHNLNEDLGLTFRTNFLFRRIDYIFCSSNLKPTISEVVYSQASDHCAVMTTF